MNRILVLLFSIPLINGCGLPIHIPKTHTITSESPLRIQVGDKYVQYGKWTIYVTEIENQVAWGVITGGDKINPMIKACVTGFPFTHENIHIAKFTTSAFPRTREKVSKGDVIDIYGFVKTDPYGSTHAVGRGADTSRDSTNQSDNLEYLYDNNCIIYRMSALEITKQDKKMNFIDATLKSKNQFNDK